MYKNRSFMVVAIAFVATMLLQSVAGAAALNQTSVRLGRLGASAATGNDLLVTFKLNTTPTSVAKIKVTFPNGFTIAGGTPSVGSTFPNTPGSITAPPGTLTAAATSGGGTNGGDIVVSGLTSASLDNTTLYGFTIPSGTITNPSSANQYDVTVESLNSSDGVIDSTGVPVYITSSNADRVTVTASVAPNFSFSLSANSDTVPEVDPSTVQTSGGVNMLVGTNSPLGYTAYVKSANGALNSSTSPGTPISTGTFDGTPDTHSAGTSKYSFVPSTGAACSTCTGSISYDAEYAVSGGSEGGAFNGTNFASFVSRNGYTNTDTINLKERVTVSNTVGYANDYTDTLTIVAAGNF